MDDAPPDHLSDDELSVLADALVGRPECLGLARALEKAAEQRASLGLRVVAMAFVYDLVPQDQERRRSTGGPYASMWEGPDASYPPRPRDVAEEVRALWRSVLAVIDDPIVCARISDLLYVALGRTAHADGRRAAACLLALTREPTWSGLDRAECLSRALEISSELNDADAQASAASRGVELVDELLGQEHAGPPFVALRALLALKPARRPPELPSLLDRVIDRFEGASHEFAALGFAADATTDPATKADLRARQLAVRVQEARRAEGIGKVALLQRAIEFADRYGMSQQAAALLKEVQDIPQSELGFETLEVSTDLPSDAIRQEVDRIAGSGATDAFEALNRIGAAIDALGGSNADVDAGVEQQQRDSPLMSLFGQTILGPESSAPHYVANTADSKRLTARGRLRKLTADFMGSVYFGPLLHVVAEHHRRPEHEALAAHFDTDLIGPDRAERIARALELFWDREYDTSAHVLVPRLESIMRDIARQRGITIVKQAMEGRYAGVISLNTVMSKLRELDPDVGWLDYLDALLCDPLAINLRNDIAHGIVPRVGPTGAALLLQAACFVALLRMTESTNEG